MNRIDPRLLEILACPACKAAVREGADSLLCSNPACGLAYPVRNGIPIMLVEEARPDRSAQQGGAAKSG
ncbi:MAG: Trm112 family protein [bacterium]